MEVAVARKLELEVELGNRGPCLHGMRAALSFLQSF